MKYGYIGPFYLHYEDNITNERRIIEDEDAYTKTLVEISQKSLKTNSEFAMKLIFQPIQNNFIPYSSQSFTPIKNGTF